MNRKSLALGGVLALGMATVVGCTQSTTAPDQGATNQKAGEAKAPAGKGTEEHGHKPGAHGGILVSLGRDSYHAEAVFEKGWVIRLYMLGQDESRVQEVDAQELTAYVKAKGATEAETVKFVPAPQAGDSKGKTSLFTAQLPPPLHGKVVDVTINNISVGGERFRIVFSNESAGHADAGMPAKLGTEEEQKVFLTPGGKYTAADVKANGDTVPSEKFKGIRAAHDDNPKAGEKICPISKTKANPKFTWVVGGKTYEFCCVPCIEEFVVLAKEKPDEVKEPSHYVKQ